MNRELPFSYGKIAAIGSGFFALMLVWTVYNTYMPLLLAEYISSSAIRGMIMGLDNLLAVLLIPIVGAWSDRVNSRLGQRLPFIVVGMPLAALCFILLPYGILSLWILLAIDIVFLLAMTIFRAPVISLMPDHTPPAKRSTANGMINLMGGIGAIIALFALAPLYDVAHSLPFMIAGILMIISFLFLFFVVDRKPPYSGTSADEMEEVQAAKAFGRNIARIVKPEYRGHLYVLVAIFLYFIGYSGVEAQFSTYATKHLGATGGEAGLTLGFFSLAFVLFALPAGFIGSKFGKVQTMLIGLIMMPLLFLLVPFFQSLLLIKIILFVTGFGWALINVQAYPLVADFGGKTKIGFFTGLYYLFSMSSAIIAPAALGLAMDLFGYPALFYTASISFIVAFFFLSEGKKRLTQSVREDTGLPS